MQPTNQPILHFSRLLKELYRALSLFSVNQFSENALESRGRSKRAIIVTILN